MEETRLYRLIAAMKQNATACAKATTDDEKLQAWLKGKAIAYQQIEWILTCPDYAEEIAKEHNV